MSKKIALILFLSVYFFTKAQQVTTLAGFVGYGYTDGSPAVAQFHGPAGICADPIGNIYIADGYNNKIRKIEATTGIVSTVAGSTEGYVDGNLTTAQFAFPSTICIDSNGNLFVTDGNNNKIRKIDFSTGMVSTFAGSTAGFANGFGAIAKFNGPKGICIDSNDNLYIIEWGNNLIRKITPTKQVTTFAGSIAGYLDGIGTGAQFNSLYAICTDAQNNIFVADTANGRIRKIAPDRTVTTIAGSGFGYLDGTVAQAKFGSSLGICIDNYNNLYITESNNRIRKIDLTTNMVSTFVGSLLGTAGSTDGIGNQAVLTNPDGICKAPNDIIYFTEFAVSKIKKITNILSVDSFNENIFIIYPNPNKGNFKINIDTNFEIEIYDLLGQLIFSKKQTQRDNYIETNLSKGIYLIKIIEEFGIIKNQKIVVE
jgi:streptogramin lyase